MTGFSYCDNDCAWDDETTADAHYQMTLAFFDKFPEFKERELYFTGESYAGLYIPMLSDRCGHDTSATFVIQNADAENCRFYHTLAKDEHGKVTAGWAFWPQDLE
jgi:carboxypeptidase C (cathepsin A)